MSTRARKVLPRGSSLSVKAADDSISTAVHLSTGKALLTASAEAVQAMPWEMLKVVKAILQHGESEDWETPLSWIPTHDRHSFARVTVRQRLLAFLPEDMRTALGPVSESARVTASDTHPPPSEKTVAWHAHALLVLDEAVLAMTRYLILLRIGPSGMRGGAGRRPLKPTSIAQIAYTCLPQMAGAAVARVLASDRQVSSSQSAGRATGNFLFGRLNNEDLQSMSANMRMDVLNEIRRMSMLASLGHWNDVPQLEDNEKNLESVKGSAEPVMPERVVDKHLPLPDDFVSDMGTRSLWLIEELGPALLDLGSQIKAIWARPAEPGLQPLGLRKRRKVATKRLLDEFEWLDGSANRINSLPFELNLRLKGKRSHAKRKQARASSNDEPALSTYQQYWPPRTYGDVQGLFGVLQFAHIFVVGMSIGPRKSELSTLERTCVVYSTDGRPFADGKTFKLERKLEGKPRDWPLPDIAVTAIEQQLRLLHIVESLGPMTSASRPSKDLPRGSHLWGRFGTPSQFHLPLTNINVAWRAYAKALGMSLTPGGQNIRSHRFRKTLARLCALALTQAPKLLMDVFGHKSIEATLYYILTDRALQIEVEKVVRELNVMRAKEIIEQMVASETVANAPLFGGHGGRAAETVSQAIKQRRIVLHQRGADFGADSPKDLAEILTLKGKSWFLVRKGVICTKSPGTEFGSCNKSKGTPEPAHCQSGCDHRFEQSFLRADVDGAIAEAVSAFSESSEPSQDLVREHWASQIRGLVVRFRDLHEKWRTNPVVQNILFSTTEKAAA